MIRSAVTVSLVPEAKGGPFVFWDGLEDAFRKAQQLGFDAVEIFAPGPDAVDPAQLESLIQETGRAVAAVGTGAGAVKHGLTLTDPDAGQRQKAVQFVESMIEFGARYQAPAIIGSMQGRWGGAVDKSQALAWLQESLNQLGEFASQRNVTLIYEPLNRYETNLFNTIAEGVEVLQQLTTDNVKLLADLFHMNIEESDVAAALRAGGKHISHVHYVDSNRSAAGLGHTDFAPIVKALQAMEFDGYLSIEAFPKPDSMTAAQKSIEAIRQHFGS